MKTPLRLFARPLPAVALLLSLTTIAQAQSPSPAVYRGTFHAGGQPGESGGVLATFDGTYLTVAGYFGGLSGPWTRIRVLKGAPDAGAVIVTDLYPWMSGGPSDGFNLADALSPDEAEAFQDSSIYVTVSTANQPQGELVARLRMFGDDLAVFRAPITRTTGEQVDELGLFIGALDDTTLHLSGGFSGLNAFWSAIQLVRYDASGAPNTVESVYPLLAPNSSSGGLHWSFELTEEAAGYLREGDFGVVIASTGTPEGEAGGRLFPLSTGTGAGEEPDQQGGLVEAASPNPFFGSTRITYRIDQAGPVSIRAYDLLGRAVATLYEGAQPAGVHTAEFDATGLAAGPYLIRVEAGRLKSTARVVLSR